MKNKLIFVIGTGRSGTHLIGRSISSNPEIEGRIEVPSTFQLISKIASTQDYSPKLLTNLRKRILVLRLKRILSNSNGYVLEKSHPALWLVDFLIEHFDHAYFIAVKRNLEPTVNSMLKHEGVQKWFKHLPQERENRFLGITKENKNQYKSLTLEEKSALRWKSHAMEIDRLANKYPDRVYAVDYESFLKDNNAYLKDIADFLSITNVFDAEKINLKALEKWKDGLSKQQIERIRKIVGN